MLNRPAILLIEDGAIARKMFRLTLEVAGYRVIEAEDATTALAAAAKETPDLVLQDLVLPDMQCFELVERLRLVVGDAVPIVAISGFQSLVDQARALATTFAATLVKPVDAAELIGAIAPLIGPPPSMRNAARGKHVLLVDDDATQLKLTAIRLRGAGYEVSTAAGGDEALAVARGVRPDIIVSDVLMSGGDGFELCRALKKEVAFARVHVVLVSAHCTDGRDQALARNVGAYGLVLRTPDFIELLDILETALAAAPADNEPSSASEELEGDDVARLTHQLERHMKLNAQLSRRCSLQTAQLSMLCGVADALAARADPAPVLTDLLSAGLDSGGISKGVVYGVEADDQLVVKHAIGFGTEGPPPLATLLSEHAHAQLLRGQPATVPASHAAGFGRAVAIPLIVIPAAGRERCVGALLLAAEAPDMTEQSLFAFGRAIGGYIGQALALSSAFAEISAAGVENARLYRETLNASLLKDEFLATVSHELRTPLSAILGWAVIARDQSKDPAMVTRSLEVIERNAKMQAKIIDDILDVARVTTGRLSLETKLVDLASIVRSSVEVLSPAAASKGLAIDVAIDPGVGIISGDPVRLQQVIWNLVGNAVKFTPRGGRVTVALKRVAGTVTIHVKDTGKGISPAFLPFIFDPFRQADASTTRREGGLGLGLAIVRHLVELHGGTLRAESDGLGSGSTFSVELGALANAADGALGASSVMSPSGRETPVGGATPSSREAPSSGTTARRGSGAGRLDGVKVVVVENEKDMRDVLVLVLEGEGAVVRACSSAEEGIDALAGWSARALVSDLGMPDVDGFQFLERVRATSSVPALALSGYASAEDIVRVFRAGFQMHLVKPVAPRQLVDSVVRLLAT